MNNTTLTIDARIEQLKARKANILARENRKLKKQNLREAIAIGTWIRRSYPEQAVAILAKISEAKSVSGEDTAVSSERSSTSVNEE